MSRVSPSTGEEGRIIQRQGEKSLSVEQVKEIDMGVSRQTLYAAIVPGMVNAQ